MDSQEETVSIQPFEIGIHKDLPIKVTIFFWGGSSEVLLNGYFLNGLYFRQIEASIGGRGKNAG